MNENNFSRDKDREKSIISFWHVPPPVISAQADNVINFVCLYELGWATFVDFFTPFRILMKLFTCEYLKCVSVESVCMITVGVTADGVLFHQCEYQ